jgi:uncharacterized protein (TIGR02452 family)
MNRSKRTALAQTTVKIVEHGSYDLPDGRVVAIEAAVKSCLEGTRFYPPEALEQLRRDLLAKPAGSWDTTIEVRNETTLAGVARAVPETGLPVTALNFASAKNPGGGFLGGSQAQEESLARSSALYASLLRAPEYYERNRGLRSCLYSDGMILSPRCPIFRDDEGNLLDEPIAATFITSPAPNAGAVADNAAGELPLILPTFQRRAEHVLALAAAHNCGVLVLGAWGCGVFRNDPDVVAQAFARHLHGGGPWSRRFQRVVFSVLDKSPSQETVGAFRRVFGEA